MTVLNFLKKPWVIILYALLVVFAYYFVDRSLAIYCYQLNLGARIPLLSVFTVLGKWYVYSVLFLFIGLYFRYIRTNALYEARAWYLLGCVLIANLIGLIAKIALSRARPELLFSSHEFGFYWFQLKGVYWSFPSGHAITCFSLLAGLGLLFPRFIYILFVLALLVAASRILLCRHYLSDVMAGLYLGLLSVALFTDYLKKKRGYNFFLN
jgi:membrane-associated phospholipid phosphatase